VKKGLDLCLQFSALRDKESEVYDSENRKRVKWKRGDWREMSAAKVSEAHNDLSLGAYSY
jgi:hypothetical protein